MNDKKIPKIRFSEFIDEWEQRKFSELVIIERGGSPRPIDDFITDSPDGLNWVKIGDAPEQGNYITKTAEKIRPEGLSKTREVHPGDLILSNSMSFGKPYIMGIDGCIHDGWLAIREVQKNFELNFLCVLLGTNQMLEQYRSLAAGSTVNNLNKELVGNTVVSYPKKDEQQKIGAYFDTIDHLITLHQRKCDSLKGLRDGIIQRIFSSELRFKRLDGREFENWVTKELSEIFTERKVSQTITEDAPLLSFTIEQGVINPQDKKTNKRDFLIKNKDTKKFALTEVDDIIYNPANLKYGAIHRNKLMRGVVSPIYAIFYTEQNPAFMEYIVKSPTFIKNSMKYLEGTVIKLMTLKPRDFLKLKVEIPASLEEQKIIADFLMKFDETIDAEQKRIEKWKELKKGLLQQMFV